MSIYARSGHLGQLWLELAGKFFKRQYVTMCDSLRTFETIVIPATSTANLKALVASFDVVLGIALAIVGAPRHVYLGAGEK